MRLVVDASVAFKWFVTEADSPLASSLLSGKQTLVSPELVLAEVLNALWRGVRQQAVDRDQLRHTATHLAHFFDELVPLRALAIRAAHIAQALDHPIYDCFYLALAERESALLVTADRRLLTRLGGTPWQAHARDLPSVAQDI
jgi:predicted nucleic acid-binding protein